MLGGPRAFYALSRQEQIDTLATLTNDNQPPAKPEKQALPVEFANKEAASWWGS